MNIDNRTAPAVQEKERNRVSIDLMRRMRLNGMAAAFAESLSSTYAETIEQFIKDNHLEETVANANISAG